MKSFAVLIKGRIFRFLLSHFQKSLKSQIIPKELTFEENLQMNHQGGTQNPVILQCYPAGTEYKPCNLSLCFKKEPSLAIF